MLYNQEKTNIVMQNQILPIHDFYEISAGFGQSRGTGDLRSEHIHVRHM